MPASNTHYLPHATGTHTDRCLSSESGYQGGIKVVVRFILILLILQKIEVRLTQREEVLDKRRQSLDSKDFSIEKRLSEMQEREKKIGENEKHYVQLLEQENIKLERISGLTAQDAKKELMKKYEEEAKKDIHEEIKKYEEKAKQNLKMESQKLIAAAAERFSNDYVAESLVSVG